MSINNNDRLIFALDVPEASRAKELVLELGDSVSFYKIGMELMMTGDYFSLLDWLVENEIMGLEWLVKDFPTIADVACFPYVALAGDGGISLDDYPAIRRWINRFKALPRFIVMPGIPPLHGLRDNEGNLLP